MIKTIDEINDIFVELTYRLFDRRVEDDTDGFVRLSYQTDQQPLNNIQQDIIYLFVTEIEDIANKVIERVIDPSNPNHLSVLEARWSVYGPNAYRNAKRIKLHLAYQDICLWRRQQGLGMVRDIPDPVYLPFLRDGKYWQRSDVSAQFYHNVNDQQEDRKITGIDLSLFDDTHIFRRIVIPSND